MRLDGLIEFGVLARVAEGMRVSRLTGFNVRDPVGKLNQGRIRVP